jgi:proteasome lid subunit RPN8/RPN11
MIDYSLILSANIRKQIIEHAKSIAPIESCGYLAGKNSEITQFYPMTNIDNSAEHFSFDPKEQFQVLKQARNAGLELLAVYHSHPETPARLSAEDIRLFNDPTPVYIIVSLKEEPAVINGFKVLKNNNEIEVHKVLLKGGQ